MSRTHLLLLLILPLDNCATWKSPIIDTHWESNITGHWLVRNRDGKILAKVLHFNKECYAYTLDPYKSSEIYTTCDAPKKWVEEEEKNAQN